MCRFSGGEHAANIRIRLIGYGHESIDQRLLKFLPMFRAVAERDDDLPHVTLE